MDFQKVFKIVVGLIGLVAIVFLARIIGAGDDALETSEDLQNSLVTPFMFIAYLILGVVVAFVLFFTLKNVFSNKDTLKQFAINIGAFAVLAIFSFFALSEGVETELRDGDILSATGSKLIDTGLYMFYILTVVAVGAMAFASIKKSIK
jgi:lysylphosphatidylglycerol synthetase-like protein (DUF2156 family)